ncbi:protein SPT2 homolog [Drosophila navojoa]|uniref:protein SPT2 homolog n=1 Tax=Drosophila navojoa TaxID=7232 RepID=UPI0011BDCFD4|nr:protein SPT2 homolog [Drosophila navojoa]
MDFGALLHFAKKNNDAATKDEGKYYSTKYAPPKKETKESKQLSTNIQKFLKKREAEEIERKRQEREKLNNLLAMRDEKSKNKIRKMLKVTKSANKSVLEDAKDCDNSALNGADQPEGDDYGYVSTEANAFYQKYIEKVKDVQEDKGFAPSRPQSVRDLSGTKERVKAAITREREEAKSNTRQRNSNATPRRERDSSVVRPNNTGDKKLYDPEAERREDESKKREEEQKKAKVKRPPQPPPMDFQTLLRLAEQKQHEPVNIAIPEKKEPERLLSAREKRELEERQKYKEQRAQRDRQRELEAKAKEQRKENGVANQPGRMALNGRIPKLNKPPTAGAGGAAAAPAAESKVKQSSDILKKPGPSSSSANAKPTNGTNNNNAAKRTAASGAAASASLTIAKGNATVQSRNPYAAANKSGVTREFPPRDLSRSREVARRDLSKTREFPPRNLSKTREFPPRDVSKTREFPPRDVSKTRESRRDQPKNRDLSKVRDASKTRAFPPADMQRAAQRKPIGSGGATGAGRPPPTAGRKPMGTANKRRIYDDDDSEYDSDLADFIDDGDCNEDISSHIRDIFGYDKRRYRDMDDDDAEMESSFAQVQREEFISKKLGLQEDLEDMRMEALHKKRKMAKKRCSRIDD